MVRPQGSRVTRRRRIGWTRVIVLGVSLAGLAVSWTSASRYRASLERGNRLYHDGRLDDAIELYRARVESELPEGPVAYNLGTALMAAGSPEAEEYLRFATELYDSAAMQRAYYNLGHIFLDRAEEAPSPEQAITQLLGAVNNGRMALRLDPRDDAARLNLAMAQYMLDSLSTEFPPSDTATLQESERSEGGLVIPEIARRDRPQGRELEAIAGEDPGSLSPAEARELLNGVGTDMEMLIRAILWSRRPDVQPWAEPYPGGSW
jgi:tetratricopeptide (TPR) repeat protein